jgi:hypothetical protein
MVWDDRDKFERPLSEQFARLSGAAKDVMMQLFVTGPTWDGNVIAKSGRDELCAAGVAEHRNGWAYLTREGVEMAIVAPVKDWSDQRWWRKQQSL